VRGAGRSRGGPAARTAPGVLVVVLALVPLLVTSRYWMNLLTLAGIYMVLALGLSLLFGFAGQVSFGHAGFFGIGAYVSALGTLHLSASAWIGMILGTIAAGAAGFVIGRPLLRLRGLSLAMGTLAFGEIMAVLFRELGVTGGPIGLSGIPAPALGSLALDGQDTYYWLVLVMVLGAFVVSRNLLRSAPGRALVALGGSEPAAETSGIDTAALKTRIFTYSAALAGLAGALYAHYMTFISSDTFTLNLSILMVVIIVVGGLRSLWGAAIGAVLLTTLPAYLGTYEKFSSLLYGLLLVVVFMCLPNGIVGGMERLRVRLPATLRAERSA
jgi:branched-chain amino acid transport system permease protein